jgi:hypothetical protein
MGGTPQFGTAEYSNRAAGAVCKVCQSPINGAYYRANAAVVCGNCAGRLQQQLPRDSHAAFVRGLLFGLGGTVLGLILYAGFSILTGIQIGIVSLAVGWLVGKAIMLGSGGIDGRRYQIAAVLLTYAAVSMAFVPIVIHAISVPKMSVAEMFGRFALLGLASPFLELSTGFSGVIGLVILFVGMRFAWQITRGVRVAISGPYEISASAKA